MKKIILMMLCVLALTACGTKNDATSDTTPAKKAEQKKTEEKTPQKEEGNFGTYTTILEKKNLNLEEKTGPFIVKIDKIRLSELDVNENYKNTFKGRKKVTVVYVTMSVENTEDKTNTFYANQSTIVTNTKEQAEPDMFISDHIDGDYMGEVKKDGKIVFILNSPVNEITSFKIITKAPWDDKINQIGQPITFNIDLKGENKVTKENSVDKKDTDNKSSRQVDSAGNNSSVTRVSKVNDKGPYYDVNEYLKNGWRRPKDLKLIDGGMDQYGQNWGDSFDGDDYPNRDPN